ncbi:MAG: hypothetical protein H6505_02465 [Calditrichaeota bacterium]|nr:hypothetical protein [Calditrichota bacterium]
MSDKFLWIGSLLAMTGLYGFTAIADDLRHVNELVAVSLTFLFGITVTLLALRAKRRNLRLPESKSIWAGAALILFGVLGFGFVADDLEHPAEIVACAVILMSGLLILFSAWRKLRLPSAN